MRKDEAGRGFVALLGIAAGVNLAWAGAVTFRVLVDLPSRHRIGPAAFAELSRATDLSVGLIFYPVCAISSALLACAACATAVRGKAALVVRQQTAVAAAAAVLVLAVTARAAPLMFQIGAATDSPAIEGLADRFATLTDLRALLADIAGVALLGALMASALPPARRAG